MLRYNKRCLKSKARTISIEDYLEFCRERNEKPDKPFSGKFVLRIPSELHHKLYIHANKSGKSLNCWVVDLLKKTVH